MFILAMRIMLRLWEVFFWHFLHRASTISSILDWAIMPIPLKIHQKKDLREETLPFVENQLTLILMTQIPFMVGPNPCTVYLT